MVSWEPDNYDIWPIFFLNNILTKTKYRNFFVKKKLCILDMDMCELTEYHMIGVASLGFFLFHRARFFYYYTVDCWGFCRMTDG